MTPDRWFGLAFIALGAGMFLAVHGIAVPFASTGDPGPKLLPYFLSAGLAFFGLLLALSTPKRVAMGGAAEGEGEDTANNGEMVAPPSVLVRLSLAVALVIYVTLFERLGFTPATFLFLAFATVILGPRTLRAAAIGIGLAAVLTLSVGGFLAGVVGVPLPGVWMF